MAIRRMGLVLSGALNDKETLLSAVRMAARESARLRIVLADGCSREMCEKHLDFALWDVQERLRLRAPKVTVESRLPELVFQEVQPGELSRERSGMGAE